MTSIHPDTALADEGAKVLGVKSRTEAVHVALREIAAPKKSRTSCAGMPASTSSKT
jgi:Arc/MetJ family transcription regulator